MAFDGPSPFDGDPVFNYLERVSGQPPEALQRNLGAAFQAVIEGGAANQLPPEMASMLGMDPSSLPAVYIDVDEGVWAWACAEMVALALGHALETPMPEPFITAARTLPEPTKLIADAIDAIDRLGDPKTSEIADLLSGARADDFRGRIAGLRRHLEQGAV